MQITYIVTDDRLTFDSVSKYAALLPPERQEKIGRYRFERDKLRSLLAGLLIRRAVGDRPLTYGEHGKPYADGVQFSVSHSGDVVAIAVDDSPVGLDVEKLPDETRLRVTDRFFHPAERDYVNRSTDLRLAFADIWTRKEAYLKMTGEGISTDLTAFDTTAPPLCRQLYSTHLDGYALSVCSAKMIGEGMIQISKIELNDLI